MFCSILLKSFLQFYSSSEQLATPALKSLQFKSYWLYSMAYISFSQSFLCQNTVPWEEHLCGEFYSLNLWLVLTMKLHRIKWIVEIMRVLMVCRYVFLGHPNFDIYNNFIFWTFLNFVSCSDFNIKNISYKEIHKCMTFFKITTGSSILFPPSELEMSLFMFHWLLNLRHNNWLQNGHGERAGGSHFLCFCFCMEKLEK